MLARASQIGVEAFAVGAVGGDLALVLVGQQRQRRGQIQDGLWHGTLP
jgi:hypothetical protein